MRILKVVTGLGLTASSGHLLVDAVRTGVVRGRGTPHGLEDDPISYFLLVGIYALCVILGIKLSIDGARNRE